MALTIVSGAAPGVEQGAIEAAINLALRWQGRASSEHIAALSPIYRTGLQPTSAIDPGMVRRLNCQDADGALVFSTSMVLVGVPAFVDRVTEQTQRAFLHVTLNPGALQSPLPDAVRDHVRDWIRSNELARVYVTGPSADDVPGIQGAVRDALIAILEPFAVDEIRETTRALSLIEQAQPDVQIVPMDPPTDPSYSREHSDAEAMEWRPPVVVPQQTYDRLERAFSAKPAKAIVPDDGSFTISAAEFRRKMAAGEVRFDHEVLPVRVTSPDAFERELDGSPEAPHPFVPGRFRCGDRGGQLPSETCDVCGRDPRNALHRAPDYPPEGLDEVQRRQLDASIREAERDIRGTGAVHWRLDHEQPDTACQFDGYAGVAQVKSSPNRAEVTCTDCRTWFARYPEPPAPGDQTT